MTRRGRSLQHEVAWLYLAGFILRPGFGEQLDPWRIKELWRCFELGIAHKKENSALTQWWILWRRVSGGLSREQQNTLYQSAHAWLAKKDAAAPELFRLLGSLERIDVERKTELGSLLLKRITGRKVRGIEHYIWTLGRLGSRVPLYSGFHRVIPAQAVEKWFLRLADLDWREGDLSQLNAACSQLFRMTGDRARDVSDEIRHQVLGKMKLSGASEEQIRVVSKIVEIDLAEQVRMFGEDLPSGLRLLHNDD
jgi:hypothetical protein